jgi:hypothetical protein
LRISQSDVSFAMPCSSMFTNHSWRFSKCIGRSKLAATFVPVNQFYHAHPFDFRRWTIEGLRWEMRRFQTVASGSSGLLSNEILKIAHSFRSEGKVDISQDKVNEVISTAEVYLKSVARPRLYSGTFFWGTKKSHVICNYEREYMRMLRKEIAERTRDDSVAVAGA